MEPELTLAMALNSGPGCYAVLLGAGISIAAGVPSAWGVQQTLLARLAAGAGAEVAQDDLPRWYEDTYRQPPTYSGLLDAVTATQAERQKLMSSFFVPDDEDRQAGRKQPSAAHRAIARLVAAGRIRIILTINFDRLMEGALRDEGIEPTVVTSPSDIDGLLPLHCIDCLVVHLHGDFLTPTAMLNTTTELAAYPDQLNRLLDPGLRRVRADHLRMVRRLGHRPPRCHLPLPDPHLLDLLVRHPPAQRAGRGPSSTPAGHVHPGRRRHLLRPDRRPRRRRHRRQPPGPPDPRRGGRYGQAGPGRGDHRHPPP